MKNDELVLTNYTGQCTLDYLRHNLYVIIDRHIISCSDVFCNTSSNKANYLFDKPLYENPYQNYFIWAASEDLPGNHHKHSEGPDLYPMRVVEVWGNFINACGWIFNVGDCIVRHPDGWKVTISLFCKNNRDLIVQVVKEVLDKYKTNVK